MGRWWPLGDKAIGAVEAETAVLEPHAGGRWYERGVDGSECEWGRVLAYEPPDRVVLDWQISARWAFDPNLHTEVESRFITKNSQSTRVEPEHRGLAAYGESAAQMQAIFESPGGWTGILEDYKSLAKS